MKEVSSSVQINLPVDQVWEKMRDLGQPHNYVPGVLKTVFNTEAKDGVGASRTGYVCTVVGLFRLLFRTFLVAVIWQVFARHPLLL